MDCWQILGLGNGADERSVKRSYARLLKLNRPDEDAGAFQRLRDAYERALTLARQRGEKFAEQSTQPLPADQSDAIVKALQAGASLVEDEFANGQAEAETQSELLASSPEHLPEEPWEAPFEAASLQLQVQPAPPVVSLLEEARVERVQPAPPVLDDGRVAQALANQLDAGNIQERWELAVLQECEAAFERLLARLCLQEPGQRIWLIDWAVHALHWLTPWQQAAMNPQQRRQLANVLLRDYMQRLRLLLAQGDERGFLARLHLFAEQPWLRIFDQRAELQQRMLELLDEETGWSLPLFEQVCRLFGWDESKGAVPQPEALWQRLLKRGEQEAFFRRLQEAARNKLHARMGSSEQRAAYLLLNPMSLYRQTRIVRDFKLDDWRACQRICDRLRHHYPDLLLRMPPRELLFWQRLVPTATLRSSTIRFGVMVGLGVLANNFFVLSFDSLNDTGALIAMAIMVGFFASRAAQICAGVWYGLRQPFLAIDLWLTRWLTPTHWNPDQRWLLIGSGVPWLLAGSVLTVWMGWIAGLIYLGVSALDIRWPYREPTPAPGALGRQWQALLRKSASDWRKVAFFLVLANVQLFYQHDPLHIRSGYKPHTVHAYSSK